MRQEWDQRAREDARRHIASDAWDTEEAFDKSGERDVELILSDIHDLVSPEAAVLEIGSGTGRMLKALARRFKTVYAVDVSAEMIRQARERLRGFRNVSLRRNNGTDLRPLRSASFDLVISYIVFQHIPDAMVVESYVGEAYRVLRPGGVFKFQVGGREDTPEAAMEEALRPKTTWDGARFTEGEIGQLTGEVGFRALSTNFGVSIQYLWVVAQKPWT